MIYLSEQVWTSGRASVSQVQKRFVVPEYSEDTSKKHVSSCNYQPQFSKSISTSNVKTAEDTRTSRGFQPTIRHPGGGSSSKTSKHQYSPVTTAEYPSNNHNNPQSQPVEPRSTWWEQNVRTHQWEGLQTEAFWRSVFVFSIVNFQLQSVVGYFLWCDRSMFVTRNIQVHDVYKKAYWLLLTDLPEYLSLENISSKKEVPKLCQNLRYIFGWWWSLKL